MKDSTRSSEREADSELILQEALPEPPPDDITQTITLWRQSMNRVLAGLALNAITLNFLALNYILPTIGLVLMLLGFRALRRENGWFRACFFLTALDVACSFPVLILNATIFGSESNAQALLTAIRALGFAITFLQSFCLWRALKSVKAKAGLPSNAGSAAALTIWYAAIIPFAFSEVEWQLVGAIMVIVYIFIICSLRKLPRALDEAGYEITAAPVRVTSNALVVTLVAALTMGIVCGYIFGGSYPMAWTKAETTQQAEVLEVKYHLRALGFPPEVLEDLTDADILACNDALRVVVDVTDETRNDGGGMRELRITGIAVELAGERSEWRLFHHFRWLLDPGFYGTESLQLWPAYRLCDGWRACGDVSGQVLYTREGQNYAAPFYSLGSNTYTAESFFLGSQTSTDIFAGFSMPRHSENQRGYVSYAIAEMQEGWMLDSWVNYTHQRGWWQYPARTAVQSRMNGMWNGDGVFFTIQDALQFYLDEGGVVGID